MRRLIQFRGERRDLFRGQGVGRIRIVLDERIRHDPQTARAVVENEDRFREEEEALRQAELIRRRRGNGGLEEPHHVVAEIPDRATREP